jgi:hypothetical protein
MPALNSAALQARRARRFLLESLFVIARERSDEAIQTKLLKAFVWIASLPLAYVQVHISSIGPTIGRRCRIGDQGFNSIRSGRFSGRRRGPRRRETNTN